MKKGVIGVLSLLAGAAGGIIGVGKVMEEKVYDRQRLADKHLALFLMMNQWVKIKQDGKNLASYFENKGYHKIAIYGMSFVGETLVDELKDTNVKVIYGIDRNADTLYSDIDIVTMEQDLDKVDVVVVTAITFLDEIKEQLSKKIDCPIISLEDILYEV